MDPKILELTRNAQAFENSYQFRMLPRDQQDQLRRAAASGHTSIPEPKDPPLISRPGPMREYRLSLVASSISR